MTEINPSVAAALGSAIARMLQTSGDARKTYVEQLQAQSIRDGDVVGHLDLAGPGELLASLTFPVTFLEKPVFASGLELADNYWLTSQAFPLYSATVINWDTKYMADDVLAYQGVHLGIVVLAPPDLRTVLHFSFKGQSFANTVVQDQAMGTIL